MDNRYQVRGYSEGLWCVVDTQSGEQDEEPIVKWDDTLKWETIFDNRPAAESLANRLNKEPPHAR